MNTYHKIFIDNAVGKVSDLTVCGTNECVYEHWSHRDLFENKFWLALKIAIVSCFVSVIRRCGWRQSDVSHSGAVAE